MSFQQLMTKTSISFIVGNLLLFALSTVLGLVGRLFGVVIMSFILLVRVRGNDTCKEYGNEESTNQQ